MAASTIPPLSVWPCGTPFSNTRERERSFIENQDEDEGLGLRFEGTEGARAGGERAAYTEFRAQALGFRL